ncbi:MAG: hypothetical protein A2418_00220 [Candidatus Brennerbacteria bacterium RIFOXYC1_FULL_41_11]|nr:MAG: hypothetical protein A2391_01680 [Candidatus Brennerbacteria bacterium RIFOXYB1_FULL_41_13]OGY39661.1 MAG: hypothetical protein A2418_00220 [Candidatus Brennerbacteria bacterium RIFOXYC1_FULL_41_11]
MAKIQKIEIQKVLGFRSSETIKASVFDEVGESAEAFVAFGKSEGKYEAKYLEPDKAVLKGDELTKLLYGFDLTDQAGIDWKMIEADGTFQKDVLGGNVMLGASVACAKLAAKTQKKELFAYLGGMVGQETIVYKPPKILFNIIEGGVHADNSLPIQEHLLISGKSSIKDQIVALDKVFDSLAVKFGDGAEFGDEGGFSYRFQSEDEVFSLINQQLENGDMVGIDAAANNIKNFDPEYYLGYYQKLLKEYPFLYFEDPFPEEGFDEYWQKLYAAIGDKALVVGDDLTVTNPKKLKEILDKKMINGIIIKPDQVGTLTETFETIKLARENNLKIAVSHRSQETNDDFLADLAVACNADFVKFGAFYQGERLAKYNRLLAIESQF